MVTNKNKLLKTMGRYVDHRYRVLLTLCVVLALGVGVFAVHEALALRITVKRIVFEGPVRSELITIINNTTEEQIYRLGWRAMKMTEDRALQYLADADPNDVPGVKAAAPMVRYAPRRIVLAPGSSQKVRLMLRRPKDLEAGEYRSHFWIQPEAKPVEFSQQNQSSDEKPRVELTMLTGLTMPVIVRAGKLDGSGSISDLQPQISGGEMNVPFTINRSGERSLYGDVKILCDGSLLHEVRGIAVYTEVEKRHMSFKAKMPEDNASCNNVSVQYIAPEDDDYFKGAVIAEASASL